jgi:hypothetical protein
MQIGRKADLMSGIGEAELLSKIIDEAGKWLRATFRRVRADRDRRAAEVLYNAFVLVASMRAYDNTFRSLLGQLLNFSIRWENERRRRLSRELSDFIDQEVLLPHFRQANSYLAQGFGSAERIQALTRLRAKASTFERSVAGKIMTEKEKKATRQLLAKLEYGDSKDAERDVRKWANNVMGLLDRRLLAEIDADYGELRQAILAKHNIEDPGFALRLPAARSARIVMG